MDLPKFKSNDELPLIMNIKDVAGYLNISVACAYNVMNSSGFPAIKIGKRILIQRERFIEWIDKSVGRIL